MKKGEKVTRGGTRPKPLENKTETEKKKQQIKRNICLRQPRARNPSPVEEEIRLKSLRQHRLPNIPLNRMPQICKRVDTTISLPKDVRHNDLDTSVASVKPTITK